MLQPLPFDNGPDEMAQAPKTPRPAQRRASTRRTPTARPAPALRTLGIIPQRQGGRVVYLVDGSRTPFLRAKGEPGPFTPVDLAVQCGRPLLARQPFSPEIFDYVILGCVNVLADEMNPARVAALRLGMG